MATTSWSDDLATGIAHLDHDHQKLITMSNALFEELSKGQATDATRKRLGDLIAAARVHIDQLESEMRLLALKEAT